VKVDRVLLLGVVDETNNRLCRGWLVYKHIAQRAISLTCADRGDEGGTGGDTVIANKLGG
jgi:hypothetical protein